MHFGSKSRRVWINIGIILIILIFIYFYLFIGVWTNEYSCWKLKLPLVNRHHIKDHMDLQGEGQKSNLINNSIPRLWNSPLQKKSHFFVCVCIHSKLNGNKSDTFMTLFKAKHISCYCQKK